MRRRTEARVISLADVPPLELIRCPATRWDSQDRSPERFNEWLRARQRWRDEHAHPLPALMARDRLAIRSLGGLDQQLVEQELAAPKAPRHDHEEAR